MSEEDAGGAPTDADADAAGSAKDDVGAGPDDMPSTTFPSSNTGTSGKGLFKRADDLVERFVTLSSETADAIALTAFFVAERDAPP